VLTQREDQTGGAQEVVPGQLTQADQRDIPCHMMSCSAMKPGRGQWDIQSDGVYLPKLPLHVVEPCFPGDGPKHLPADGKK